jgi:trk system potassium uptake protein TrkH
MALLSLPICIIFAEYFAILPFLLTALISLGFGQLLYRLNRQEKAIRFRQTLLIVAASWAILFAIGAIPYLLIAIRFADMPSASPTILAFQNGWNALFEAISGYTSTGLTMAQDSSQLPHSLQWWRSFTQWVGGIGLIVLTLSVLEPSTNVNQLYSAETREERLAPTLKQTAQEIWRIYILFTVISIVLLLSLGMPLWAAINHGLTAIATGGFAITGTSFQNYGTGIKLATLLIMVAGGMSFLTHSRIIRRRQISALWQGTRYSLLWIFLAVGAGFVVVEHYLVTSDWRVLDGAFQWVSALTTCGFSSFQAAEMTSTDKILMTTAMIFGAISGSTAGGLKLDRIAILYKAVVWHLRLIYHESPESLNYEMDGQLLSEQEAHRKLNSAVVLALLWLAALGIGTLIVFHVIDLENFTLIDALFECASALGTSGLSTGIANPDLFWLGKLTLMLLMWMGRLEIVAVLVLFAWLVRPVRATLPGMEGKRIKSAAQSNGHKR